MSHAEYTEWAAFAETEPLPALRGDIQTAMIMLLLYTANKGKRGKKLKLGDFLPDYWQDKRSPRNLMMKFRALTAHLHDSAPAEGEPSPPDIVSSDFGHGGRQSEGKDEQERTGSPWLRRNRG